MELSGISWTHHTMNFWLGCDKVSELCSHCYIDRTLRRQGREPWGQLYRTSEALWRNPAKWEKKAAARGKALRIFTCSLSDFFHQDADGWRDEAWSIIRDTPHLAWLVLTKRPGRIASHLPSDWGAGYRNVWLGVSAGSKRSMRTMNLLRDIASTVRFISAEPLLEDVAAEVNFLGYHWCITGGESGTDPEYLWEGTSWQDDEKLHPTGRRTMKLEWAHSLRDRAHDSGARFFFKQETSARPGHGADALGRVYHEFPDGPYPWYTDAELQTDFGKKAA